MPAGRAGIAKRYAEAVFDIAKAQNSFDKWSQDLEAVARVQELPEVAKLLATPAIPLSTKEGLVIQSLGDLSPQAKNLVRLLLHKGRFVLAPGIADHYRRMLNEHRGIAVAYVTSAVPLGDRELEEVANRLSTLTGRRVVVEPHVDQSIIGGIVARVGDQLIDASVRGRLEALKRRLVSV